MATTLRIPGAVLKAHLERRRDYYASLPKSGMVSMDPKKALVMERRFRILAQYVVAGVPQDVEFSEFEALELDELE